MLNKKEVKKIAELAHLELNEKEIEKMQKDISNILDYFDLLRKLEFSDLEPAFRSLPVKSTMREDKERNFKGKPIEESSNKEGDYIKVKKVLE